MTLTRVIGTKNLAHMRHAAETRVEAGADAARRRFRTPGKDGVYLDKRTEARDYLRAAGRGAPPDLAEFPYLAAEIGISAPDAAALAALWVARDQEWRTAGPAIERAALRAKAAIRQAGSQAAIDAAAEAGLRDLGALGAAPPAAPRKPDGPRPNRPGR